MFVRKGLAFRSREVHEASKATLDRDSLGSFWGGDDRNVGTEAVREFKQREGKVFVTEGLAFQSGELARWNGKNGGGGSFVRFNGMSIDSRNAGGSS